MVLPNIRPQYSRNPSYLPFILKTLYFALLSDFANQNADQPYGVATSSTCYCYCTIFLWKASLEDCKAGQRGKSVMYLSLMGKKWIVGLESKFNHILFQDISVSSMWRYRRSGKLFNRRCVTGLSICHQNFQVGDELLGSCWVETFPSGLAQEYRRKLAGRRIRGIVPIRTTRGRNGWTWNRIYSPYLSIADSSWRDQDLNCSNVNRFSSLRT